VSIKSLHNKNYPKISLGFGWVAPLDYISGGLALQKMGRKRETWATQLSRAPSKAGARGAEPHSTLSECSFFTLAKLELPQFIPIITSG
jgi:hypothetical protein